VLAAPQAVCGQRTWQQIGLTESGVTIEDLAGDAGRILAGSRAVRPGVKLFRGSGTTDFLSPVAGFLSTADAPITVNSIAVQGEGVHVALGGGGVLSSNDGGANFAPSELVDFGITALAAGPEGLYAAASNPNERGVYRKDAQGGWVQLAGSETFPETVFWDLSRAPDGGLWASTVNAGPWHAPDGVTFGPVDDPLLANATVLAIAVDPSDSAHVLAGLGNRSDGQPAAAYQRGLVLSTDGGRNWRQVLPWGADRPLVFDVAVSRMSAGVVVAATWGRGLLHSANGGRSWHRLPLATGMRDATGAGYYSSLLTVQPASGCEILLAGGLHGLWGIDIAAAAPRTIYLPSATGAWRQGGAAAVQDAPGLPRPIQDAATPTPPALR
jgi:photosystem II stability/assembly factor-like uncharacterized protein